MAGKQALGVDMIIASRQLTISDETGDRPVPITIYAPVDQGDHWRCQFDIMWPDRTKTMRAGGFDSAQALYLAMQAIAVNLYASPYHEAGTLRWGKPGTGYGFPMPRSGLEDLIGEDRESQLP